MEEEDSCLLMKVAVAVVMVVVEMELGCKGYHKQHTLCTGSVPWKWF
jgi:hypothetical protein